MEDKNTSNDQNESTELKKTSEQKKDENKESDKKDLGTRFRELRGEFKKIIWPNRTELTKQTITVVVTSLSFGLVVFVIDAVFSFGYSTFIDLLTKI